jgi:hypothetical protein
MPWTNATLNKFSISRTALLSASRRQRVLGGDADLRARFATGMIAAFLSAGTFIVVLWTIGGTLEFPIERVHLAIPAAG